MVSNRLILNKLRNYVIKIYEEFKRESKNYKCKIVNIESNNDNDITFTVMLRGIKSGLVKFSPEDLVLDDQMLREFSAFDARAITFFAIHNNEKLLNNKKHTSLIFAQEFEEGKTIFIIKKTNEKGLFRRTAHELYADAKLLEQFNHQDLKNIIITAIQEKSKEDFI